MEQKQRFINLAQSGRFTVSELSEEFGITRKTGHKWLLRYAGGGMKGLEERSRAPKKVSNRTSEEVERLIVSEKRQHMTWGPKKIQRVLMIKHGLERLPVVSTVGEVLRRHGMVEVRKRRGAVFKVERGALTVPEHSNHVVGVDFKGWFMTGDGKRCDPLTVTDLHSRYLLMAEGLTQATTQWTQAAFRGLFRRKGLPEIIRVDNGAPFASMGPGGLSRLSVWWIGLGIEVQFSRPSCPQDNGSHERMHRTMKAECCKPPSANLRAQQQRFDRWRKEFNQERPHEALGMRVPADVYHPSAKRLDERIKPHLYDLGTETKSVSAAGFVALNGRNCYVVGPEKHFNHFSRNAIGMILAVLDYRQNLPAHSKSLQSASMKPTSSNTAQTSFLLPDLEKQLDPRSLLYRLAQAIDWKGFEQTFGSLYSTEGRPALPIRRMVGLLMLKSLRDLSDEEVVEFWSESAYAQYFCGEKEMSWGLPCDPSELTHFRKRIGTDGAERILASTIDLHGEKAKEKEVVVDTTVQEKNITFPTDTKLAAKIVRGGVKLANKHGVKLRQSFERTVPKLLAAQRGRRTKGGAAAARKASRRLKTIAGQVVRQLDAGLPAETKDRRWLETAVRVLNQKRKDGDKIYSLHEPEVYCMSKGKEHKKYEFGAKASLVVGKNNGVILGAYSLPKNDYDGHALEPTLAQVERVSGYRPAVAIGDKGFRGKTHCGTTEVVTPNRPKKNATAYEKRKAKARFRRRAAIEPRIGHLKSDFRLGRNFLKGQVGDAINLLLAAAASNLSLWMRQILFALVSAIQNWARECRTFRSPLPA